ncbi:hypothetical protein FOZ62_003193 [Perkinsus olseni]|uniref:Uncharacterized protein n=1 Tax=Perkinsus olseni TaxID=32597 RepID=A0A7J6RQQ6_PEROL|nr:hypothetical protein FOZ62_003193 [Perkinsus olseni]
MLIHHRHRIPILLPILSRRVVATSDLGYCQWVLNQEGCNGQLALFKSYLQGTAPPTDQNNNFNNNSRRFSQQHPNTQHPSSAPTSGQHPSQPPSSGWRPQNPRGHLPTFQEYAFSAPPATRNSISTPHLPLSGGGLPTYDPNRVQQYSAGSQPSMPPYQTPRTLPWQSTQNNVHNQHVAGYRTKSAPAAPTCQNAASDGKTYNFRMEIGSNGSLKLTSGDWLPRDLWRALSFETPLLRPVDNNPGEYVVNEALMPNTSRAKIIDKVIAEAKKLPGVAVVEPIPQFVLSVLSSNPTPTETIPIPEAIDAIQPPLKPYQRAGVEFALQRRGRCLLGDEMGLGKTLQALAVALAYRTEWPVLVICPPSLKFVWKDQILEWLKDHVRGDQVQVIMKGKDTIQSDAKFVIVGYPLMNNSKLQTRPNGSNFQVVICDECHAIKDSKAQRTRAVIPVIQRANRAILISGTPALNRAAELYNILYCLLKDFPSESKFHNRYCIKEQQHIGKGRVVNKWVGAENKEELYSLLTSTIMIRRLKKDVLKELPEKNRIKVPLDITDSKAQKVLAEVQQAQKTMRELSKESLMNGGGQRSEGFLEVWRKTGEAKIGAVKDYLDYLLDNDCKMLVFAHHRSMLDKLEEKVDGILRVKGSSAGKNYGLIRIDGQTPQTKRPELVKKFQEDDNIRVAVLSITACSEGLTLTAASVVVFAELYWVPGTIEQAEARVHRIGQTKSCVDIHYLIARGSPDEAVYACLKRKKEDTSAILNGEVETLKAHDSPVRFGGAKRTRPINDLYEAAEAAVEEVSELSYFRMFFPSPIALTRIPREMVFAMARGSYGRTKKCFRLAIGRVMHDLMRSYIARQKRSRIHRCHWIARLNAATREYNMPYAHFINGVRTGDMMLSRRVLTTLAETEPITFKAVLDESKRYWKVEPSRIRDIRGV